MRKKIISIDLDGVLNNYNGSYNPDVIPPIKDGALNFLQNLSQDFKIEIFTVRDKDLTRNWLEQNNLLHFVENISNQKNKFASIFLDDRALNFDGNFEKAFNNIKNFNPYWKNM